MCGICGIFNYGNKDYRVTEKTINCMRDTMIHRGPDGEGTWISKDAKIGLGHRRLSIIDLSESASQPMCNEDGTLWVVFNGEIYNHSEIRRELEQKSNHCWNTNHSDTEVILHAFEEWGIDGINKFRGMFAIALWDDKLKELWLIRDRIGIKPLYYSIHHGRITFASEIKALLKDAEQTKEVNEEAFYHYLSFLTTPAPDTLFYGIKKMESGTWLRIREAGEIKIYKYWDVLDNTKPLINVSEEEIADKLLQELRTAVRLRKVSDVPVGAFLSGGIDSSTNAALFSEGEEAKIKTFSIGYDGDYQTYKNELEYARLMASQIEAEHHEKILKQEDFIQFLPKMIFLQDEPIADPVCMPSYYVSKLARENGVIVCQVGEGSDELFCGYPWWKKSLALEKYNRLPVPKILKYLGLSGLELFGKKQKYYYELLRRGTTGQAVFWGGAEAFTEAQKKGILSDRLNKEFKGFSSWEAIKPIRKRFEDKAWEKSDLNWMSYLDLSLRLPELLLMRVDKMSMGVSLEGRVPFLDHKFVEVAMSIPEKVKIKDGELKYILKKAVRGLIPDEIINRKKQGFAVPIYEWYMDELGDVAKNELRNFCQKTDYLKSDEVMHLFDINAAEQIWYLLNFALWWKEYIEK